MHAQTWPALSSTQAGLLADDWRIFTYAGLAIALFTWTLILVAAVRFRRTPHNRQPRSQIATNPPLEFAWTVLPLLIVIALFAWTQHIETEVEAAAPRHAAEIDVEAFRWGWTFAYRDGPTVSGNSNRPPEIELPLNETVAVHLRSRDVVHSFWIPDMLFKRDAVPGRETSFDITPSQPGTFLGRCGEFCGLNHALMTFAVRIVSPAEYHRWRAKWGAH